MNRKDSKLSSRTDWAALDAMTDDDINYSDIPPLTEEFFEKATLRIPATKARNLIELEPDVIAWFKSQSSEYRDLIHSVLRRHMENSRS